MKYCVVTTATVRRVYYVEAENEKAAVNQTVFQVPDDEDDINEEVVSSNPWPDRGARTSGERHE